MAPVSSSSSGRCAAAVLTAMSLAMGGCQGDEALPPPPPHPLTLSLQDCAELIEQEGQPPRCLIQEDRDFAVIVTGPTNERTSILLTKHQGDAAPHPLATGTLQAGRWVWRGRAKGPSLDEPMTLQVHRVPSGEAPPEGGPQLAAWLDSQPGASVASAPIGWRLNPRYAQPEGSAADGCTRAVLSGRFDDGIAMCEQAWRPSPQGLSPYERATFGLLYAYALRVRGDASRAALILEEVVALSGSEGTRRLQAKAQMMRANVLIMGGRPHEAIGSTGPVLEAAARLQDLQGELELSRMRGSANLSVGNYQAAQQDLARALHLAMALADDEEQAKAHVELAKLAALLGDAPQTLSHLDAAEPYYLDNRSDGSSPGGARQEDRAFFLNSAAELRLWASYVSPHKVDLAAIERQLLQATEILKATQRDPWAGRSQLRAAEVALLQGDVTTARQRIDASTQGKRSDGFKEDPAAQDLLARLYIAEGRPDEAIQAVETLAELGQSMPEARWRAHHRLGQVRRAQGDLNSAAAAMERAMNEVEAQAAAVDAQLQLGAFLGGRETLYWEAQAIALAQGDIAAAFLIAERARASHNAARHAQARASALARAAPEAWSEWMSQLSQLKAAQLPARDEEILSAADRQAAQAAREAARQAYIHQARAFSAWAQGILPGGDAPGQSTIATLASTQAALETHEALLAIIQLPIGHAAYWVTHDGVQYAPISAEPDELEALVNGLTEGIMSGASSGEASAALAALLIAPFAPALATQRRLIIIPHGALFRLPFAALPMGEGLLADQVEVVYSPSVSTWLDIRQRRSSGAWPAATAQPLIAGDSLNDLPHAAAEAKKVAALTGATALVGDQVTSPALLTGLGPAEIFHFAGHGRIDGPSILGPHLALAGGARLSPLDLLMLPHRPRKVVLSGCETAGGVAVSQADVTGMTPAFLRTGAVQVISSFWPIKDGEASPIVTALHGGEGGWSSRFNRAQAQARRGGAPARAWAGYALWGDGDPLTPVQKQR